MRGTIGKERLRRILLWVSVAALALGALPLYAISLYNHPYYDDYGFSAGVHQAWRDTGSLTAVLEAAWRSARDTRQNWQGTYTGTLLSNLQPGVFSEQWYFIGSFVLLTALIACFLYFFTTVFGRLGMDKTGRWTLGCLAVTLLLQFMPDAGEGFYWFNGGIGNTFVYSLLALAAALLLRLLDAKGRGRAAALTAGLCALMVLLGGGSYGGGLFGLCLLAAGLVWLFRTGHARRWHAAGLFALFLACFVYSMSAPGNAVRAGMIGYRASPAKAVAQSLYLGAAQMGAYLRLPLIAVTLAVLPAIYEAAKASRYRFAHPWLALGLGACLYCTQLTPPLYSIASIGDGRIVNTYFISFVALWFPAVYYAAGFAARRLEARGARLAPMDARGYGALLLVSLCLFATGALGCRPQGEALYGVQNLNGPSAALSILTGEAARYDAEMTRREALLNDASQPVVTLAPLEAVPDVFMEDLIVPNAVYDVRPSLCRYYGKQAVLIEGEEAAP